MLIMCSTGYTFLELIHLNVDSRLVEEQGKILCDLRVRNLPVWNGIKKISGNG